MEKGLRSRIGIATALLLATLVACAAIKQGERAQPDGTSVRQSDTIAVTTADDLLMTRLLIFGGLAYSTIANHQADSAYRLAQRLRKEPAMCVASHGYAFGIAANQTPFVYIFRFATSGPQAARVGWADSIQVHWNRCADSLPTWHGHIVTTPVRYRPSECDLHGAAQQPWVPFHIVQSSDTSAHVYMPTREVIAKYGPPGSWCNVGPVGR